MKKTENPNVFSFDDYRDFLKTLANSARGKITQMASFACCERSYFSRVIGSAVHLTPDHAFRLSESIFLKPNEQEYFLLLVERDRSGDSNYKKFVSKKLSVLKRENENLSHRTSRPLLSANQKELAYQSHWLNMVIHLFTSIPELQTPEAMSKRLQLPLSVISRHLKFLIEAEYVEMIGKKYFFKSGAGHSPRNSTLTLLLHQTWRNIAVTNSQDVNAQGVHFTSVQTLSCQDFETIKNLIIEMISTVNKIAEPSSPEELMVFTCDFFSPSQSR